MEIKEEQFYTNLKHRLNENTDWPSEYLFKFIIPSKEEKLHIINNIFGNSGAVITTKTSSKGKFTSLSIRMIAHHPDEIIDKYKQVGKEIEGVISL